MKWFRFGRRAQEDHTPIPSVKTPMAHLVGPGSLHAERGRLAFKTATGKQVLLDLEGLETLLCYGEITPSAEALALLSQHDVRFSLLSAGGHRVFARLEPGDTSRVLLRLLQFRALENPENQRRVAQQVVIDKIHSQAAAARHYQRQGRPKAGELLDKLLEFQASCTSNKSLDELRGFEGAASAAWFKFLASLLHKPWSFPRRIKHPPTDPVNALLSLGYTLLLNRTTAMAQSAGLEPTLGCLHAYRPGRMSLACDQMESLRIPAVDRWAIRLCNQQRVSLASFRPAGESDGGLRLNNDVFPQVLADWEEHWYSGQFEVMLNQMITGYIAHLRKVGESWAKLNLLLDKGGLKDNFCRPAEAAVEHVAAV